MNTYPDVSNMTTRPLIQELRPFFPHTYSLFLIVTSEKKFLNILHSLYGKPSSLIYCRFRNSIRNMLAEVLYSIPSYFVLIYSSRSLYEFFYPRYFLSNDKECLFSVQRTQLFRHSSTTLLRDSRIKPARGLVEPGRQGK